MDELISRRLRHRVRLLGDLLGRTMAADRTEDFLRTVEEIRVLAKTRRQHGGGDHARLRRVLSELSDDRLVMVARAFSQFLNLTNIAEQVDAQEQRGDFPAASHLARLFEESTAAGIEPGGIVQVLERVHCDLVLTAHPTEIARRTLIQKYNRLATALRDVHEDEPVSDQKREELARLVAEVWHTDEIREERPTPQVEAKWGFAVIEHSFWEAVPTLWLGLDRLLARHTGQRLRLEQAPIRVSSWMGGDRDGNPNVTAAVTSEVLRLARWMAADLYLRDVEALLERLSMSECSDELRELSGHATNEPYREVLRTLRARLEATRAWAETDLPATPEIILHDREIFDPLAACHRSLHERGMGLIADGMLKRTLIRSSTFGATLVKLDIRQSSDKHVALLDAVTIHVGLGSYAAWTEAERMAFLEAELASNRPLFAESWLPEGELAEILATFRLIASLDGKGIACYIISMASKASDVLAVVLLLRKCGVRAKLPVVPLFETLADLEGAAATLESLLRLPWYLDHIDGHQQVMIGYSDSAKDAGQMAAAWAQYRAQEDLARVAASFDVVLTFFHGRGGAAGRGGVPVRQAILSQPPGTISEGMRVTEQGEIIRFKYGTPALALDSLDLILSATIEAALLPPPEPAAEWRAMMDRMAGSAEREYRSIVQHREDFIDYFSEGTPERELALLALGSRPVRRDNQGTSLSSLRAIPWVFAWTQKRMMLPAWLGTETALAADLPAADRRLIEELAASWPFFQTQLDMLEMVLSKADNEISEHYDKVLLGAELQAMGDMFRDKLRALERSVNRIKGQSELLEKTPALRRTLDLRDPYTDPLHFLQIELISRHRRDDADDPQVRKALLVTIAGIAASMRNTG